MAELRPATDGRSNTGSLQRQQGTRPHRPGRTITCYYCGLVLHEKHLQAHMTQCHMVMEGCPNKCGVTVERHEMQRHLENECMNARRPTTLLQSSQPQLTTNSQQNLDKMSTLPRREVQHNDLQLTGAPEEWNDKVVAALMVIKKTLLKEETERCRIEAELKQEIQKVSQHVQITEDNTRNSAAKQVNAVQFYELKEELLLLKESLLEERQERHRIQQQLAYEVDKSNMWYQQIDDLKQRLQECNSQMETWKIGHQEEVNKLLQEVIQERQQRIRAETELKMEAAKLEDLCYTMEEWRDEDRKEKSELQDQHQEREVGWKRRVEQQKQEVDQLQEVVSNCCRDVNEFREFLTSENIMISGLWTEQLAEVKSIKETIESVNKALEEKRKEIAQLKQRVIDCDEAVLRQSKFSNLQCSGHIIWKICEFEEKMSDAKKNDTVLHGPAFYSSQYGYKLRVNNLVKNLVEGREKEDPAGLYVFIPHTTLQQQNYVVNNVMFLEVKVG